LDFDLVEDITSYFSQQVQSLVDTVKQMDTALQRRSKAQRSTAASGPATGSAMTDSEKIYLQISFDVSAFGEEVRKTLNLDPNSIPSFKSLLSIIEEAKQSTN